MPIFLALVLVPLIEIALFVKVGGALGLWPTLAIVLLTALAGAMLLRAQGLATVGEIRARIDRGEDPSAPLAHGALILAAGLLLLTPGFFTDTVGLALLIPAVRAAAIRYLARRVVTVVARGKPGATREGAADTVEGEYEVVEPERDGGEDAAPGHGSGGQRR
ncbi:MAG TPA: FxsA family protein [Thermohalobaculum sp.]|nr:FxsA family protein [Thermohalobaculum sp.]